MKSKKGSYRAEQLKFVLAFASLAYVSVTAGLSELREKDVPGNTALCSMQGYFNENRCKRLVFAMLSLREQTRVDGGSEEYCNTGPFF
jgi:hypothetical protein